MYQTKFISLSCILAAVVPLTVAGANRRQNYDQLTAASDKVVVGVVGAKNSYWGDDSRIYTDVVVTPDVSIKGAEEGPVVIRTLGGVVGETRMMVSDGPELPEGERAVVFLKQEDDHFVVTGRAAGSVILSAPEAADAVEGAFSRVERAAGTRLDFKRSLAQQFLGDSTSLRSRATAVQTGCYSVDGAKWGTTGAAYKIGPSVPATWAPSIDASAATWNNAGAAFRLNNDPSSTNELSYADLVAKYGSSYSNTYAVTTTWSNTTTNVISKATIEINNKWQWSTSGQANMADVQNILTHEFGHWMRLLDIYSPTTCGEVTMWGSAAMGETKKRTLEQADLDGFVSLYGRTAAIGTPVPTSPANGATGVSSTPTLTWTAASSATAYDVYFGTSTSPGFVATVAGTSYQPGNLSAGATYYWRVVAKNAAGASASSGTFSFTVASAPPPASSGPTLITPANGATGVSLRPLMQWSAVSGATTYDVYIGAAPSPGYIGSISSTAVYISGLQSGTAYYWKIVARTPSGALSSTVASFRTN